MSTDSGQIRVLGPDGFRMIPDTLLLNPAEVSDADVRLYGLMLWHGRNGQGTFPGRKILMAEMGKSSLRTIDACLDRLMRAGYLKISPQYDDKGRQTSNLYTLLFTPLPPDERQTERPGTATGRRRKSRPESTAADDQRFSTGGSAAAVDQEAQPDIDEETAGQPTVQLTARGPVQSIARGGRATDCTDGGATDCTGTVQLTAPIRESKVKREEEEGPSSTEGDQPQVVRAVENSAHAGTKTEDHPIVTVPPRTLTEVYRALPRQLTSKIRTAASRKVLDEIGTQLQHRTPEELLARVERNWAAFDGLPIHDGVGAARRVLRRGFPCIDVRCEDGVQLDTGESCRSCGQERHKPSPRHVAAPPSGRSDSGTPDGETATPPVAPAAVPPPRPGNLAAEHNALRSSATDPVGHRAVEKLRTDLGWVRPHTKASP